MGDLRILYSSNAPWASSGYGVQGHSLLPRLAELPEIGGREAISVFAWYGLQGGIHNVDGFRIYPAGADAYGNDIIAAHTRDAQANVVISLIDVWVMQDTAKKVAPALWCPWLPIDHDPVPQRVLDCLKDAYLPLTYSKWGHAMLTGAGVENHYIPHGVEPGVFRVLDDTAKVAEFRRAVFGEDCTNLSVIVAANKGYPDRKAFQVQIRAWAAFAKDKPGAKLYIHTEPTPMYGGLDLPELCKNLGILDRVLFPDRYKNFLGMPADYLALLYNAADVYLGATMSEGFGIPIVEAQACGTPVIVTDFSAMPELVRWGYAIQPRDMIWTPQNSWQAWPDHEGITDALNSLHAQQEKTGGQWQRSERLKASAAIHNEYSWDSIVREQWRPLIAKLAEAIPKKAIGADKPAAEVTAKKPGRVLQLVEPPTVETHRNGSREPVTA